MHTTLPPGTRFEVNQIFLLDDARMDSLEAGRDVLLAPEDLVTEPFEDERALEDGMLCLAIRDSWLYGPDSPDYPTRKYTEPSRGWIIESDPRFERVDHLARNARVATFRWEQPALVPFGNLSLGTMLDAAARERSAPVRSLDFLEGDLPIDPTPEAVAAAQTGWFTGLWHVCSCGIWDDSADFVLIQNFVPVLLVGTTCGSVWRVDTFPAKLEDDAVATRRKERAELIARRTLSGR